MMKETKMKRVPKLRFPEFTDDWEQRKVGELTLESSEYATLSSKLPLLTSSRSGLMYQNEYRGNLTTESEKTIFSVVPVGTCTYRHMSDDDIFHLNINTIEKGLVSREYPVFMASEDNVLEFIVQYINSSSKFRAFCAEQKKGGTRTRLYYKTLCEFSFMVTKSKEQQRIAEFFTDLDHLITLHQRKLEKLKKLRKGMMQKLFSQEIRFKADDGSGFPEWEEKKVGSLGDIVGGGTPSTKKKEYWCGKIAWVSSADIGDNDIRNINITRFITREAIADSATKIIPKDSILIVSRVGVGKVAKASCNLCTSQDFTNIVNLDGDVTFLSYAVLRLMQSKLQCVQGTSIKGIPNDEIKNYTLNIPCLAEQQKIANCLSSLDGVIEKQKATLAAWEELKKGLLQQMFV